jgi:hypothetical protein
MPNSCNLAKHFSPINSLSQVSDAILSTPTIFIPFSSRCRRFCVYSRPIYYRVSAPILETKATTQEALAKELANWSDRKKTLFTNPKFIEIAFNKLKSRLS